MPPLYQSRYKGGFLSTKRKLSQVVPKLNKKSRFLHQFLVAKDSKDSFGAEKKTSHKGWFIILASAY